jgi:hypothetical protein
MNRRSFLIRSAGTVGALLTTQFLKDAQWLIANQEQALLVTPVQRVIETLYAVPSEGRFALFLVGMPNEYLDPQFTWEEFGNTAWGHSEEDTLEYLRENYDLCKSLRIPENHFTTESDLPEQTLDHLQYTCETLTEIHTMTHHRC